ncbi:MAG: hypothetical protein Unbinned1322contig1000_12 [Prokaryotic dsDNA virus sp.]|nr:hypothetical protein [Aequorivita sp.]QDP57268.1 MAG: hypothetical protein Unbinned1322contig1000_12 [Prokaryotic dsDNA virus sp.]|tara:strand:+ start:4006 stop:4254 length:249 start_codon:yes stop_codon:yes gene_type:complete
MDVVRKMRGKYQPEVYDLAMCERVSIAEGAIDSLIVDMAYKIEQSSSAHPECDIQDFKGLLAMEDIIADRKTEDDKYEESIK